MSVMKALAIPETLFTRDGKRRVTHEAYTFHITPYLNPPVKLEIVKGLIDRNGLFLAIPETLKSIIVTTEEFRELISPTPQGKPAGDFRLSDVLNLINRRGKPVAEAPKPASAETKNPITAGSDDKAPVEAPASENNVPVTTPVTEDKTPLAASAPENKTPVTASVSSEEKVPVTKP